MKVRIGRYPHWYTTTRVENAYLRWRHKKFAWDVDVRDHDWIDKVVMGALDVWQNVLHYTINQIQKRRDQRIRVHVDDWDVWNADVTLAHVILPVLKRLRDLSYGCAIVDPKDVPARLKPTKAELDQYHKDYTLDDKVQARWDWVIGEMIFAFESIVDDSWEEEFFSGESDILFTRVDADGNEVGKNYDGMIYYYMDRGPNSTLEFDGAGYDKYKQRIQNGLNLFAKYYLHLWD